MLTHWELGFQDVNLGAGLERGMQTLSLWHEGGAEGDCDCVFPEGGAETEKGHKPTQYSSEWRLQRTSAVASS